MCLSNWNEKRVSTLKRDIDGKNPRTFTILTSCYNYITFILDESKYVTKLIDLQGSCT